MLFSTNKILAKLRLGAAFPLDWLLAVAVPIQFMQNPSRLAGIMRGLWPFLALFFFGLVWLLHDINAVFSSGISSSGLVLRRWAMAYYMLLPTIILFNLRYISLSLERLNFLIAVVTLGLGLYSRVYTAIDFSSSLAALVIAVLIIRLLSDNTIGVNSLKKLVLLTFFIPSFLFLIKDPNGGFLRSPILSLVAGLLASELTAMFNLMFRTRARIHLSKIFMYLFIVLLLFMVGVIAVNTKPGRVMLNEAVCSANRTLTVLFSSNTADCAFERRRGDPAGTIKTRIAFWHAILKYSYSEPTRLLFGSGHTRGFLEVVPRDAIEVSMMSARADAPLIEPHNSYLGLLYRYGLVGLGLFLVGLVRFSKLLRHLARASDIELRPSLGIKIAVLTYLMNEVVLEVPYGALTFWLLWMLSEISLFHDRALLSRIPR